jgi:hypothetical protein
VKRERTLVKPPNPTLSLSAFDCDVIISALSRAMMPGHAYKSATKLGVRVRVICNLSLICEIALLVVLGHIHNTCEGIGNYSGVKPI